jgi:hypothetical protein
MSQELITSYIQSGNDFIALAKGANEQALLLPPDANEWSGTFIIHHMADFEIHFTHRILRLLTEENPPIDGYSEEPYPNSLRYDLRDWQISLALIEKSREMTGDILKKVDLSTLQRPGIHSERGAITLGDIVGSAAKHISSHKDQLATTIATIS